MDMTTPEEILKKHLDIIPTRLTETTEAYVLAAMREYGELKQSPPPELDAQKMEELRDELDNITDIDKLRDLVVEKKAASLFYARGCFEKHAQILELQRREKQSPRLSPEIAKKILAIRDEFAKEDYNEAYHILYSIANPGFDSYEPWEELEKIAADESESPQAKQSPRWQLCPKCNGGGYAMNMDKQIPTTTDICDVCEGKKIIKTPSESPKEEAWVRVEDGLPEFGETVLVYYPSAGPGATAHLCGEDERKMLSKVWSGIFDAKNIWDHPEMFHPINDVTHWQPLPNPPKS